jgi:hypothetical protein
MYSGVHPVCNRQNFAKCAQILGKILSKIYFKKSSLDPIKMCAYPMVAAVEIPGNKPLSGGEIPKEIRGLKWKLSEGNKGGLEWKLIFKASGGLFGIHAGRWRATGSGACVRAEGVECRAVMACACVLRYN